MDLRNVAPRSRYSVNLQFWMSKPGIQLFSYHPHSWFLKHAHMIAINFEALNAASYDRLPAHKIVVIWFKITFACAEDYGAATIRFRVKSTHSSDVGPNYSLQILTKGGIGNGFDHLLL